jgi:Domain of unknown function (DUF4956)/VTC domain
MLTMYADYAIDLLIDVAAIFSLAYVLYFRRHRRADLLLAYVSLNIGIFVAMSLLSQVRVDIALGFGLFAILSIIRLRSTSVTQQEVAYYFVALVMGLVNGLDIPDRRLTVFVNILLLVTMALVDGRDFRDRARRIDVHLDVIHADDAALVADLERRLGGTVTYHEVNDIDYVRETMVVDVRYKVGTAQAQPQPDERRIEVTLDVIYTDDAALVADLERRPGGPARGQGHRLRARHHGRRRAVPRPEAAEGDVVTVIALDSRRPAATVGRPTSIGSIPARWAAGRPAAPAVPTPAERAVAAAADLVDPIGLDELNALAELQTRVDRKYFVPAEVFRRMIGELAGELRVLDIDGSRTFGYESVYFDTPQFTTYKAHVQRRRQRFKARTRTYTDTGLCMFEVKLTGARGETVKERVPHPQQYRAELTEGALDHLRTTLCQAYHQDLPAGMRPTLVTTYRRTTFVSRTGEARLTCDSALRAFDLEHEVRDTGTHVLVESKSGGQGGSAADRILRELGVRPASVSKYCVAVAALHPELPSNPWHLTLKRYFSPMQAAA